MSKRDQERIRVVLADDHRILREGLRAMLSGEEDLLVVAEAESGLEALEQVARHEPRVAVLDYSMPGLDGIGVIQELRQQGRKTAVVLLTMHKERSLARRAVEAGADAVVLKDDAFGDLAQAIRTVAEDGSFVSPGFEEGATDRRSGPTLEHDLSAREREVLGWIARGHSNKEIARELCISIKTVETHRAHIMRKLDVHTTAELTRYAVRTGIVPA